MEIVFIFAIVVFGVQVALDWMQKKELNWMALGLFLFAIAIYLA